MSLGYAPFLRPGTLIFTAIVWRHLLNGSSCKKHAIEEVYGHIGGRKRNLMGERVTAASTALFADSLSPDEVLLRHTLFGVYSRALSRPAADAWGRSLVEGEQRARTVSRVRVASFETTRFATADLRSCKSCLEQDLDEFGFPSWRVLHVVPSLHHCPYHGDALVSEVEGAVGGNMWKLQLPLGKADKHSCTRIGPATDGYAMYLRLWVELFEGRLPVVEADNWASLMDLVVGRAGGVQEAVCELTSQLTQIWNERPEQIANVLGPQVMRDFLSSELGHRSAPGRIAQKLVILTACERLKIGPANGAVPEQLNMPLQTSGPTSQFAKRETLLRGAILNAGFPLAMMPGLVGGFTMWSMGKLTGIHRHLVQKAIDGFTDQLLQELSAIGRWPDDSWLSRELRRRGGAGDGLP